MTVPFAPFAAAVLVATPAFAQTQPQTIKGLEKFSLPPGQSPTPTPSASPALPIPDAPRGLPPVTRATPTPTSAPTARPARTSEPTPRAQPTPRATPTPTPTPSATPIPVPTPVATPILPPAQIALPPVAVPDAAPVLTGQIGEAPGWPWLIGIGAAILIAAGGWFLLNRRRTVIDEAPEDALEYEPVEPNDAPVERLPVTPEPVAAPAGPSFFTRPAAPPAVVPRGRLALSLRPVRAGVNLLSATVECEITLRNTGDAAAEAIRLDVRLLGAHADQDAELDAIFAQPVVRAAVPVFALAAGEERQVRAVAALPRASLRRLMAGGRPMFVPIVTVNATYIAAPDVAGQTAQAFAVGVERADSPKLSPFWLDGPPRTFDTVAARPHTLAIER